MADPNTPEGRLQAVATQIAGLTVESLVHPAQAATYNFEPQRQLFESIISFFADIVAAKLSHIPEPVLTTMFGLAGNVFNALTDIKNFNVRQGDPNTNLNNNVSALQNQWQQAYNFAIPHIAFAKVSSSAIAQELQAITGTVNGIQSAWAKASALYQTEKEATAKLLADKMSEFENVIAAAREASGKEAVSRQAQEFEDEAKQCLKASRLWFGATIGAVIVSLIVVYVMFLKIPESHQTLQTQVTNTNQSPNIAAASPVPKEATPQTHPVTAELLQQTVARILIVTLLYSAVVWFARNYFASRHNYTVNRHRRNAMQTFRAFVEGTKDIATQDFILRQAAACAFSPQQSGYLKDESLPNPAPSAPIIDFIRPPTN